MDGRNLESKAEAGAPSYDKEKRRWNKYAIACTFLASISSILLGYDTGVMSGAVIYIKRDLKISDTEVEVVTGIINLYALLGSAIAGKMSDWIGRRYTLIVAAVIFFVGALIMGISPNYAVLMIGRFIAGIGVGFGLMIAPVYTAELSPTASRGTLTSLPEVFINFGVLLGYVSNYTFARLPQHLSWRMMLGVGAVPPIFLVMGALVMPESPRWLVMQGRIGDARRVLIKTSYNNEEAEDRLVDIKNTVGIPEDCKDDVVMVTKRRSHGEGVWREMLIRPTPAVRRVLVAAVGIHFFQQASGIDAVVLYSPRVFEKAGIKKETQRLGATIAVGCSKTFSILVATFFLDKVGRRPLLLSSVAGMIISLVGLASGLVVINHYPDQRIMWAIVLCIVTILTFVGSFSMGLGPIAWVYSSEILPLRLRAQGSSMGVSTNRVMSGVIGMTFISMYKAMTIGGTFGMFAGIMTVAWIFFYTFLPETRGKSLEELEHFFEDPWSKKPKNETENQGNVQLSNGVAQSNGRDQQSNGVAQSNGSDQQSNGAAQSNGRNQP